MSYVDQLEQERDQLRARVAELESELNDWITGYGRCDCGHKHCSIERDARTGREVLNRQPTQSLAAIEARALREYGKKYQQYRMDGGALAGGGWMQREADRIEAEDEQ